jgi:hypothetical protein
MTSITASMNKLLGTLLAPAFVTPILVAVACCPTLTGRILVCSAPAPFLPPFTTAACWSHGKISVVAIEFIIPWQDPVAIDGSAYIRLQCYKSLFPPPEPSHLTCATKTGMSSIYDYTHLEERGYFNSLRSFNVDFRLQIQACTLATP